MSQSFDDLADKLPPTCAFVEVEGRGYGLLVGGVSVLERVLRGLYREGVVEAAIAAEPIGLRADLPVRVRWMAPGTAPSPGWRRVRGDEVNGRQIVSEADRVAAEWALLRGLTTSYQGIIAGLIGWRLSLPITRLLSYTPVRPNHVTLMATLVGLGGGMALLSGERGGIAVGGLLLMLQMILDNCDGQLARLRFQTSKLGQWFDNIADDVIDITFIVCAGVALGGSWTILALAAGLARAWGQLILFHEVYRRTGTGDVFRFRIWFQSERASTDEVFERRGLVSNLRAFGRRDTYVFMWMVLCLLGQLESVVVYGAVVGALIGVLMTAHLILRSPLPARR